LERLPALDGAFVQLVAAPDYLPGIALAADPDRERQAVVALLADHPVAHVSEPVELALLETDALRQPLDLARHLGDRLAQRIHADEPLIHQAENELRAAPPAARIAVQVAVAGNQQAPALKVGGDYQPHLLRPL